MTNISAMPHTSEASRPENDAVETYFAELGMPTYSQATEQIAYLTEHAPGNFAVLIADNDGLKDANDDKGHLEGDKIIMASGTSLLNLTSEATGLIALGRRSHSNKLARDEAIVALDPKRTPTTNHRKGDEFIIVLPDTATQLEVDAWIETAQTNLAAEGVHVTISGRPHQPGETARELLTSVDRLLKWDKGLRSVQEKTPEQLEAARKIGELATTNGLSLRELAKIVGFLPFIPYEAGSFKTDTAKNQTAKTAAEDPSELS